MTGETTEIPEIPVYVKPNQRQVTIRCPKCRTLIERFRAKSGVDEYTDFVICTGKMPMPCGYQFTWRTTTDRCHHCKTPMNLKHDSDGWDLNHWEDLKGNVYCENCFHDLYTEPEEKATDNLHHDDKRVRERAKAKLEKLKSIWGTS